MPRYILDPEHIHASVRDEVASHHRALIEQVKAAVERDPIVVVGMAQNPFCRKARRCLDGAGQTYTYLEYGSYLSQWRSRTALKMWTGWPTFPMVFIRGALVGGFSDLQRLIDNGALEELLSDT